MEAMHFLDNWRKVIITVGDNILQDDLQKRFYFFWLRLEFLFFPLFLLLKSLLLFGIFFKTFLAVL